MTEPLAVSPFLVGDPLRLGPEISSFADLVAVLDVSFLERPDVLYRRATTMTLSAIVACQVGDLFACRTDHKSIFRVGLFSNPYVFLGIVVEIGLLMALILVEPISAVFNTAPVSFPEWGMLLILPPAMLRLEEGRKGLVRIGVGRKVRS